MGRDPWEEFNDGDVESESGEASSGGGDDFAKMLEDSFKGGGGTRKVRPGERVRGQILVLGKEDVFVSLGGNREGILPKVELLNAEGECPNKTGDTLDLYVTSVRGAEIRLSTILIETGRGAGRRGPSSREQGEEQRTSKGELFTGQHQVGDMVKGRVQRLEAFGAFIEVAPGVEGLAHVSEISWTRIKEPSEVLTVGQEVTCKILKMESSMGKVRISLSMKQVGGHPWESLPPDLKAGQVVEGKVTRCAAFGAFVELAPGIEGLIPLSEMSYTKRVMRSDELVKEGEKVVVKVLNVDAGARRVSLSLKDAGEDPWALVPQKFPVGTVIKGKVERREAFGLFVRLDEGVTGLMPKSKALESAEFAFDRVKIGQELVVQVAELRPEERRMTLQPPKDGAEEDWKNYSEKQKPAVQGFGTLGAALQRAADKKKK